MPEVLDLLNNAAARCTGLFKTSGIRRGFWDMAGW
jgi:hypothetical protein